MFNGGERVRSEVSVRWRFRYELCETTRSWK